MSKTKFCFNTFYLRMSAKFCGKIARTNPNFNTKHLTKKNEKSAEISGKIPTLNLNYNTKHPIGLIIASSFKVSSLFYSHFHLPI